MNMGARRIAMSCFSRVFFACSFVVVTATGSMTTAQPTINPKLAGAPQNSIDDTPANVLSPEEWKRVDVAVDHALTWLAASQRPDGSFPTLDTGQPAVTCLCTMAFMAHGHIGGKGPYGKQLELATEYAIHCQKANGLVTLVGPDGPEITRDVEHDIGVATAYNHAISSLMLSETYGSGRGDSFLRLKKTISNSIAATLKMQRWPKNRAVDRGGWRYLDVDKEDSDLSITGWELQFLRSARNAGFDVPKESIDEAIAYVRRTYSNRYGAFGYAVGDYDDFRSRGMAGAGILAFAHAGYHNSPEAARSGEWILRNGFDEYNKFEPFTRNYSNDRYHYVLFNCCQGMYQLGGRYWEKFYPRVVHILLANQRSDGSWAPESHFHDAQFGNAYTTALVVLCLGAPNQLLPIFQR
jgi:hypothetical protein